MNDRERAQQLLKMIPPDKIGYAIAYMQGFLQGLSCSNNKNQEEKEQRRS